MKLKNAPSILATAATFAACATAPKPIAVTGTEYSTGEKNETTVSVASIVLMPNTVGAAEGGDEIPGSNRSITVSLPAPRTVECFARTEKVASFIATDFTLSAGSRTKFGVNVGQAPSLSYTTPEGKQEKIWNPPVWTTCTVR